MIYLIIAIILFSVVYAWISLAPWIPTSLKDLEIIDEISDLKSKQTFLEIGCGNGRVCSYIAKKNPSAKVIGIELALPFYLFTKIKTFIYGPKNLKILFGDALKYNISNIDVVYVYGLTKTVNKKIKDKADKEMSPETKLISYVFSIDGWKGKKTIYQDAKKRSIINVYTK